MKRYEYVNIYECGNTCIYIYISLQYKDDKALNISNASFDCVVSCER